MLLNSFLVFYALAVFSDIPVFKKWRTIYIETAMSTMNHQWLATELIPMSIVNEVMDERDKVLEAQALMESVWNGNYPYAEKVSSLKGINNKSDFLSVFDEIDETSFDEYISLHPNVLENGYAKLLIDESALDKHGTSIRTTAGDEILTIDAANGILIIRVSGSGYCGKLAIIKDSSRVKIAVSSKIGSSGETVKEIADDNNAILAVNASGFSDAGGVGNGGLVLGLLVSNGELISKSAENGYLTIGFGADNRLYIGHSKETALFRDAIEFTPAEVINGQNVTEGSTGFGIQPRTSIGQTADGEVLLLTVDGRQVGYSIGCTVGDCAEIMLRYDAEQASNVDGGSSTVMVYRGNEITRPANGIEFGRYVPNAFIVEYAK